MSKFVQKNCFYTEFEKAILIKNLTKKIKKEDNKFFNRIKKQKIYFHSRIKRKLKTEYGKLEIRINRYYKKVLVANEDGEVIGTKKEVFYCDFWNQIVQKGRTIANSLIEKILNLWYQVRYGTSICRILNSPISISAINLILKKTYFKNEIKDYQEIAKEKDFVFLAVDDCFSRIIENKKIYKVKNRMLVLYLGKEKGRVYGKTNILEVRKVSQKGSNIYQLARIIKDKIRQIYGKEMKIIIYGDGANWIKRLSKILNGVYILDKFHLLKKLSDLVSLKNNNSLNRFLFKDKFPQLYQKLLNFFKENKPEKVIEILRQLIKYLEIILEKNLWLFSKIKQKIEDIAEFLRYVISNSKGIYQLFSFENASSYTESFVANLIKFNIQNRYATYSLDRFYNNLLVNHYFKETNLVLI